MRQAGRSLLVQPRLHVGPVNITHALIPEGRFDVVFNMVLVLGPCRRRELWETHLAEAL